MVTELRRYDANTPNDRLVETGRYFQAPSITDHKYWAIRDQYYPDRWDIGTLMQEVKTKASPLITRLRLPPTDPQHLGNLVTKLSQ